MTNFDTVRTNLEQNGFAVSCFATGVEAADYLVEKLAGKTVGHGGSMTLTGMGLLDRLENCCTLYRHAPGSSEPLSTQAYLCSANALAETGEIINIDGAGNRVAATIFGREELYLVVGKNKLAPDYDAALWRARNIAAPKNAQRLNRKTPCAVKGDKCYNCNSPERICRALTVLWKKPLGLRHAEVILIDEELGY